VKAAEVSFLLSTGNEASYVTGSCNLGLGPNFPGSKFVALTQKITSVFEEQYKMAC
jgi:hypothetical protein